MVFFDKKTVELNFKQKKRTSLYLTLKVIYTF